MKLPSPRALPAFIFAAIMVLATTLTPASASARERSSHRDGEVSHEFQTIGHRHGHGHGHEAPPPSSSPAY